MQSDARRPSPLVRTYDIALIYHINTLKAMDIIVPVKQVIANTERITLSPEGTIDEKGMTFDINEYDKYSLEEALLIREQSGGTVTAVTVGPERTDRVLRDCIAKGADKAIRIWEDSIATADNLTVARILAAVIGPMQFDLILTGVQAVDDGGAIIGPALARLLGINHATMVTGVQLNSGTARVRRELEDGVEEILDVDLPTLFAVQTGINTPRYASVRGIMKAKQADITIMSVSDIGMHGADWNSLSLTTIEERYIPQAVCAARILTGTPKEATDELIRIMKEQEAV